ncbi:hypothetical protein HHL11_23015 [Ramlibacter sp. G-1-2-2]|uniref:DUF4878 domain-containing protein n=1 Tax=Ramlibacter agri TaxID=2728837 RepID=A0A848H766_9BURK|nr:hypothetical protein [Ramlibacter agri]NML46635.1 hypothetical protein [Ramlibacter agri]
MRNIAKGGAWPLRHAGIRRRRQFVLAIFFGLGVAVLPPRGYAQATDPAEGALSIWKRFLKAASRNDLEGVLACLSPGGRTALASSLRDMSARARLPDLSRDVVDVSAQAISGDTVTVRTVVKVSESQNRLVDAQVVKVRGAWLIESF